MVIEEYGCRARAKRTAGCKLCRWRWQLPDDTESARRALTDVNTGLWIAAGYLRNSTTRTIQTDRRAVQTDCWTVWQRHQRHTSSSTLDTLTRIYQASTHPMCLPHCSIAAQYRSTHISHVKALLNFNIITPPSIIAGEEHRVFRLSGTSSVRPLFRVTRYLCT